MMIKDILECISEFEVNNTNSLANTPIPKESTPKKAGIFNIIKRFSSESLTELSSLFPKKVSKINNVYIINHDIEITQDFVFPPGIYKLKANVTAHECEIKINSGTQFHIGENLSFHGCKVRALGSRWSPIYFHDLPEHKRKLPYEGFMPNAIYLLGCESEFRNCLISFFLNAYPMHVFTGKIMMKKCDFNVNSKGLYLSDCNAYIKNSEFSLNKSSAIEVSSASKNCYLECINTKINKNHTKDNLGGAGIKVGDNSLLKMVNCEVQENESYAAPAGIDVQGTAELFNTKIMKNRVRRMYKHEGSGLFVSSGGSATLDKKCVLEYNRPKPQLNCYNGELKYSPCVVLDS